MFLSSPVTPNNYVQTACLPPSQSSNIPAANLTGVTVGWGTNSLNGSRPGYLSNVRVDIYSETEVMYTSLKKLLFELRSDLLDCAS